MRFPKLFIVENVTGLLSWNSGQAWALILDKLGCGGTYTLSHHVRSPEGCGLAQSRKRIYLVGVHRSLGAHAVEWPIWSGTALFWELFDMGLQGDPSQNVLSPSALRTWDAARQLVLARGGDFDSEPWVVDVDVSAGRTRPMLGRSPCLMRSHPRGPWISCLGRRVTLAEQCRFQGLPGVFFPSWFPRVAAGKALGNAMNGVVCLALAPALLAILGRIRSARLPQFDRAGLVGWLYRDHGLSAIALAATTGPDFNAGTTHEFCTSGGFKSVPLPLKTDVTTSLVTAAALEDSESEMSWAHPGGDREKAEPAESKDPGGASTQPQNQNAIRTASKFFAHPLWALTAEDVKIDSLDIYRDVMATRKRLRDTLNHKKRPCHAELVTEGKKRLVRMTDALAKFKADSRATVRAAVVDKAVVEHKLADAAEDAVDKEEETILWKLETVRARRKLLREVKQWAQDVAKAEEQARMWAKASRKARRIKQ